MVLEGKTLLTGELHQLLVKPGFDRFRNDYIADKATTSTNQMMVMFRKRLRELKDCRSIRRHDPRDHRTLLEDGEVPIQGTQCDALGRPLEVIDRQGVVRTAEGFDEFSSQRRISLLSCLELLSDRIVNVRCNDRGPSHRRNLLVWRDSAHRQLPTNSCS